MKIRKCPKLTAYGMALGILAGTLAESPAPVSYSLAQEKAIPKLMPPPKEGYFGIWTTNMEGRFCGSYIEEEHWDGLKIPKFIAYYESEEKRVRDEPSHFAIRNDDGFTYNFFSMPDTRCERCHKEPKEKEYLFLKAGRKPI